MNKHLTEQAFMQYLQEAIGNSECEKLLNVMQKIAVENKEVFQMENRQEFARLKAETDKWYTKKR